MERPQMSRRSFVKSAAALAALSRPGAAAAPNVVIIYTDDMGYGDLGCYGGRTPTPNLDAMARQGMRFTSFYVAQAVCSASRAALLTGCYPHRVGILGALGPKSTNGISGEDMTIAQLLKQRDYATAVFGKWHLGHLPQYLPLRHGFDEYFGLPYSNDMWPNHPTDPSYPPLPLIEGERVVKTNPDQNELTTAYTERAVSFIKRNSRRPFFLYLAHNMPHVPLHVSKRFRGKSGAGLYGDVLQEIDWSAGEVMKALREHGLEERTLVIFCSDNGPWLSYGDHAGSAGPLREGKGTSWEGGVRVPCIMRWPGTIPAGAVCGEPAMTIDVLPTLAALTGTKCQERKIDGRDIGPLLRGTAGAASPHEALFFYWGAQLEAVRRGRWKLHFPHPYRTLAGKPGGTEGKPAEYRTEQTGLALYDLEADIGERNNLIEKQ